jgi:hypothetical protein
MGKDANGGRGGQGSGGDPKDRRAPETEQGERRGSVVDRRVFVERRTKDVGAPSGLERRRGAGRRLSDFTKAAEQGEMTQEQFMFLMAIEGFKKANAKMFPSWTDVLEVIRLLGYRKTMKSEIVLANADDWREPADAPAKVRPDRWAERGPTPDLSDAA